MHHWVLNEVLRKVWMYRAQPLLGKQLNWSGDGAEDNAEVTVDLGHTYRNVFLILVTCVTSKQRRNNSGVSGGGKPVKT